MILANIHPGRMELQCGGKVDAITARTFKVMPFTSILLWQLMNGGGLVKKIWGEGKGPKRRFICHRLSTV